LVTVRHHQQKMEVEGEASVPPWAERLGSRFTSILTSSAAERRRRPRIRRGVVVLPSREGGDGRIGDASNLNAWKGK